MPSELFREHPLNETGKQRRACIIKIFDEMYGKLMAVCPFGKEFDLVRTKLEEACYHAKKALEGDYSNLAKRLDGTASEHEPDRRTGG
jgi:hypothetical protein